ncbi:hypothetical protein QBC38DRAFT_415516 [Podospora fimiseda]|uniref:Uncharacterized protein n=1 Tax=Podospora fimiseda TaxID=252190 RepID=A0AAN7BRB2_9PEZI|nr:hypothetical protein QBC38DRAFT_415516 [Podospora fimiseda]
MACYQDDKIIEKYLFKDPPQHPRRTLHQSSCSFSLRSTRQFDRHQILLHGTRTNWDSSHRLHTGLDSEWFDSELNWYWSGDSSATDEFGCEECKEKIKRTPRIAMVDQLWMSILDGKTLITSFPNPYGCGFDVDLKGVYASIRARLDCASTRFYSVYDLGLIVIDECSKAFFNPWCPSSTSHSRKEERPAMEIFADRVGKIVSRIQLLRTFGKWLTEGTPMSPSTSKGKKL